MQAIRGRESRKIDEKAMETYRIPGMVLMENAALRVFELLREQFDLPSRMVVVLAGKGNNGGDGIALFRHLVNLGVDAHLVMTHRRGVYKGDAKKQVRMLARLGAGDRIVHAGDRRRVEELLARADVLVDAVFGTGFSGEMPPPTRDLALLYNRSPADKVAVDIPSGLDGDTGAGSGVFESDMTITFGLPKTGLFLDEKKRAGTVFVGDISLPRPLLAEFSSDCRVLVRPLVSGLVKERDQNLHKGRCGRVLVAGGSRGMTGAMYLAAEGAVRSGAGLVSAVIPSGINAIMEEKLTEAMTIPLEAPTGFLTGEDADRLREEARDRDVLALGPGMGRYEETTGLVGSLLSECPVPLLLDADALYHLSFLEARPVPAGRTVWLTPHTGEAARLLDCPAAEVEGDRETALQALCRRTGAIVILKGSRTLVGDGTRMAINTTGNPGMATGGAGDVLTGVLAALGAQGMDPFEAACAAVYLHGLAGDLAAQQLSEEAMKAGDITVQLGQAFQAIRTGVPPFGHIQRIY